MNWKSEMDELRRREEFAERLGGAERVKRQHDGGRLTIRGHLGIVSHLVFPGASIRESSLDDLDVAFLGQP